MAGLPHWDNSTASTGHYEPVFLNQFIVDITPPGTITQNKDILIQQVISIKGLPEFFTKAIVTQGYKFADRAYAGAVPETTLSKFQVEFEVNLDDTNNMYVYNTLRGWSDLIYDPATGRQGLKKDYIGQANVQIFNKAGDVFRSFRFSSVFLEKPLTQIDLGYRNEGIYKLTASFVADKVVETRVGQITV
jgi:hypothetical protein